MAVAAEARSGTPPKTRREPKPVEYNVLLTATLCLLAAGAVMVYSASSARTLLEGQGDGTMYLVKYVAYAAIGLVVLQLLARGGLEMLPRLTPALLGMTAAQFFQVVLLPQGRFAAFLQAPAAQRPSTQPGHLCRGRRFVDENQPVRLLAHSRLAMQAPPATRLADVITPAFRCQNLFFYI